MFVERLSAFHFRNLEKIELNIDSRAVVLRGANGQGKTNVLEALYLCATGRSFRNAPPKDLLRIGAERGSVSARSRRHAVHHEVEVTLESRRRNIRVDGKGLRQASRLLELLNVVAFFPDHLSLAKGSPEERRRFVDRAVANQAPSFVDAAVGYQQALRSRNALLRSETRLDPGMLSVYDEQLIKHGAAVDAARRTALAALSPLARGQLAAIMPRAGELSLELSDGLGLDSSTPFAEAFREALRRSYARDRARGMTTVGPHRADLLMRLGGREVRAFASQGQQRAIVLALKIAEVQSATDHLQVSPIMLLDDVSSELDREHTALLFEALASTNSQLWVSTTGAAPLPLPSDLQVFAVESGKVTSTRP